jgi:hypothetical protein
MTEFPDVLERGDWSHGEALLDLVFASRGDGDA